MSFLKRLPRKTWSFLNVINRLIKKDEKRIFIYSNMGFRDNVRAIYDYLLEHHYADAFQITVSLNDYEKYADSQSKNIRFTGNLKGCLSFFRSKYCFYCFGKYPIKPAPGQAVFNLWHGMPLKRVGNMIKGCEKTDYYYFTHLLCTSDFFREIMKKSFCCKDENIVICGQPRTDIMLRGHSPAEGEAVREKLFGPKRKDCKVILWLPTFRENNAKELDILSAAQLTQLQELCAEKNYLIFIKPHPLSKLKKDSLEGYERIRVLTDKELADKGIGFYKAIYFSEALITDYSSVYFDYMLLDKPIAFVVSDMTKYDEKRGFVFEKPLDFMPGDMIRSGQDLLDFVRGVTEHKDPFREERRRLCKIFNQYRDDQNCKRALEAVGIKK